MRPYLHEVTPASGQCHVCGCIDVKVIASLADGLLCRCLSLTCNARWEADGNTAQVVGTCLPVRNRGFGTPLLVRVHGN
jgi:hypothetical protein